MSRRKISPVTNKPTPKPLPTPEEQKHRFNRTRFTVAVWWREGVGGQKSFNTLVEARAYAASKKKMGYPKWRTSQVFVWKDTLELIDVIDAAEEPTDDNV